MQRKRKVALGVAAGVLVLTVVIAGAIEPPTALPPERWEERVLQGTGQAKVAVLQVRGEIVTGRDPTASLASSDLVVSQLRQARRDPDVAAVILRLDTPGGSVVASDEILAAIRDVQEAGKPVVASMADVAASGGYFIASGADRIVANPSTITGSIGVIMVLLNLEGAAGKLGVDPVVIKSGRFKDIGSPFREMTKEERGILQALIDEAYERFVGVVAEGRQMPAEEVRALADGRLLSGQQAHDAGLIDQLGGIDEAIATARELAGVGEATVVEYERPFSFGDLFGGFGLDRDPVAELEDVAGATGPALKYLYVP